MIERPPKGPSGRTRAAQILPALTAVMAIVAACGGSTATPSAAPSASASSSALASSNPSDSGLVTPEPSVTPAGLPTGYAYSDLDGVAAPAELAHRLPVAVMVDDNAVARPQSGFSSASIVYQAPADGGEDRYEMIFQEGTATDIGPIRSARPYFVYWAAEYKAGFGHYGGDAVALGQTIPSMAKYIYNMDALNGDSCPYHRITTRAAPHNAYTNSAALISCAVKAKQPAVFQTVPTRTFTDDTPVASRPASQTINIAYRTGAIGYQYDPSLDAYLRLVGGKPQTDPANTKLVYARDIVVMFQQLTYDAAQDPGHNRPILVTVGSGESIVFKEGVKIHGKWKKATNTDLTRFYDDSGVEIPLVRGEIFIQAVQVGTGVTVK